MRIGRLDGDSRCCHAGILIQFGPDGVFQSINSKAPWASLQFAPWLERITLACLQVMFKNCIQIVGKAVRCIPRVSLLLTVAAMIIHFSYSLRVQLLYDRSALAHYELWRLITCHWVHLSTDHLFWSAATFFVLESLCEIMDLKKYYATAGISAIAIPIVIWWAMPDLMIYGGLSGLDCTSYSLLMVLFIKRELRSRSWIWVVLFSLLLGGLAAKIIYEATTGLTIFVANTHTNMTPVPLTHLVGGCVGFFVGLTGVKSG
jgi:rhomboid family GlyGly-CTERM serine protease